MIYTLHIIITSAVNPEIQNGCKILFPQLRYWKLNYEEAETTDDFNLCNFANSSKYRTWSRIVWSKKFLIQ